MNLLEEIKMQIAQLNMWTKAYDEGHPIVSDKKWDEAYFRLVDLENKANIHLPNSPTQKVVYEVQTELKKVTHNHPNNIFITKILNKLIPIFCFICRTHKMVMFNFL